MKIILTSQSSAFGGVERRLIQEAKFLRGLGHEVFVATPYFQNIRLYLSEMDSLGVKSIGWNPYKFIERNQAYFPFSLAPILAQKKLRNLNPDIAHVALTWTSVGMTRLFELHRMRIPVLLSLHCTYPLQTFSQPIRRLIREALVGVIGAYAVSEGSRQSFLANFKSEANHFDVDIVNNGVSTVRFGPNIEFRNIIRANFNIPEDAFLICFCGRLDSNKDPLFALKLLCDEHLRNRRVYLIFAGDGPLRDSLIRVSKLNGLNNYVIFAGFTDRIAEILAASDAYISCSRQEAFSLALAEALASGLPSLVPDESHFDDFSSCGAVYRLARDRPTDWVDAIVSLIDRGASLRSPINIYARQFAENYLSETIMFRKLKRFYERYI